MSKYEKGDIVLVNLGDPPKEIVGHEQALKRPCVVLANFEDLELTICVPCTTKINAKKFPTAVFVKTSKGGLNADGYVLVHQLRCLSQDRILHKLGHLPNDAIDEIDVVLADMLDI